MFGLPRHEPAGWLRQLERAIELRPDHLSSYQLTIHAGTPFAKQQAHGTLIPLPEGPQADLYRLAVERLTAAGYAQYEVSNFAARPAARLTPQHEVLAPRGVPRARPVGPLVRRGQPALVEPPALA